jgi:hypothetical protein
LAAASAAWVASANPLAGAGFLAGGERQQIVARLIEFVAEVIERRL